MHGIWAFHLTDSCLLSDSCAAPSRCLSSPYLPGPVVLDDLPVCPALTMTRPVSFLLSVMVGPLLRSHLEQRRPVTETVEPCLASPARHPGLERGAVKARSLRFPSLPLVPHAPRVALSLLGTARVPCQ